MLVGSTPTRVNASDTNVTVLPGVLDRIIVLAPGSSGSITIWDPDLNQQVETATVAGGPATSSNDVTVIVTAAGMTGSPVTVTVAVADEDTDDEVAALIRADLAADAEVAAFFIVSGAGALVVLTAIVGAANDATINIDMNMTAAGLNDVPSSTTTEVGGFEANVNRRFTRSKDDMKAGDVILLEMAFVGGMRVDVPTAGDFIIQHGTSYR